MSLDESTSDMDMLPMQQSYGISRDNLEYELTVRQEPKQARMCGVGADRRPIDPPPIVQLRVLDPATRRPPVSPGAGDYDDYGREGSSSNAQSFLQNPYYFMFASLAKPDDDAELHWLKDGKTRCTTGSVVSSLYHLKDTEHNNEDAGFFVFPDLSVRTEGSYRLKLSLFEVVGNSVRHCRSIYSAPFYVYTAKKFPGMEESTPLSCSLADQGIKIRIRKDIRVRKRPIHALEPLPDDAPSDAEEGPSPSSSNHKSDKRKAKKSKTEGSAGLGGLPPWPSTPIDPDLAPAGPIGGVGVTGSAEVHKPSGETLPPPNGPNGNIGPTTTAPPANANANGEQRNHGHYPAHTYEQQPSQPPPPPQTQQAPAPTHSQPQHPQHPPPPTHAQSHPPPPQHPHHHPYDQQSHHQAPPPPPHYAQPPPHHIPPPPHHAAPPPQSPYAPYPPAPAPGWGAPPPPQMQGGYDPNPYAHHPQYAQHPSHHPPPPPQYAPPPHMHHPQHYPPPPPTHPHGHPPPPPRYDYQGMHTYAPPPPPQGYAGYYDSQGAYVGSGGSTSLSGANGPPPPAHAPPPPVHHQHQQSGSTSRSPGPPASAASATAGGGYSEYGYARGSPPPPASHAHAPPPTATQRGYAGYPPPPPQQSPQGGTSSNSSSNANGGYSNPPPQHQQRQYTGTSATTTSGGGYQYGGYAAPPPVDSWNQGPPAANGSGSSSAPQGASPQSQFNSGSSAPEGWAPAPTTGYASRDAVGPGNTGGSGSGLVGAVGGPGDRIQLAPLRAHSNSHSSVGGTPPLPLQVPGSYPLNHGHGHTRGNIGASGTHVYDRGGGELRSVGESLRGGLGAGGGMAASKKNPLSIGSILDDDERRV